ncbi:hypothetical protein KX928_23210 [Roseobacter sp. YSTF-M11]|uniref:Uncharacterized protein n=1 Tax=Roseobacter insulae TaxID=2859783 RepID=A0A9X1FZR8_9RHOB|nr:hypothetical protein [Roseobacter insulae]MBW4710709.1 hypothetical protein [Roseobacter insulae]
MADHFGFPLVDAPAQDDLRIRTMTDDEKRGFRFACQTMELWGAQIERNAAGLAGLDERVSLDQQMKSSARMLQGCATAMERTLGR